MTSDNPIVDKMNQISIVGDVIPPIWFSKILKGTGRADLLAINILANLVYWYRPTVLRDEATDAVIGIKKKFSADLVQKQYSDYASHFGASKSAVKDSMDNLEGMGLIQRHFRNVELENGVLLNNRMFIEIFPEKIKEITFIGNAVEMDTTLPEKNRGGSQKIEDRTPEKRVQYTYNSTKNTPKIYKRPNQRNSNYDSSRRYDFAELNKFILEN